MTTMMTQHRGKQARTWRNAVAMSAACLALVALWEFAPGAPGSSTLLPFGPGEQDLGGYDSFSTFNGGGGGGGDPQHDPFAQQTTTMQQQQFNAGGGGGGGDPQVPQGNPHALDQQSYADSFAMDASYREDLSYGDPADFGNGGMGGGTGDRKPDEAPVIVRKRNQNIPRRKDLPPEGQGGGGGGGGQQRQGTAATTGEKLAGDAAKENANAFTNANANVAVNGVVSTTVNGGGGVNGAAANPTGRGGGRLQGASSSKTAPVIKGTSALFLSFHEGTAVDFNYVARKLGVERVDWKFPRSQNLPHLTKDPYAVSSEVASAIWDDYEREACQTYNWIVVGDTIPAAGRAFIEGLLGLDSDYASAAEAADAAKSPPGQDSAARHVCKAKVILLVTTRFDYQHFHDLAYRASFQLAVARGLVTVVANNPFEEWYMFIRGIQVPQSVPVIRPHGQGWKEWKTRDHSVAVAMAAAGARASERDPRFLMPAVVANRDTEKPLVQLLTQGGVQFELLNARYGGPFALAQYRCLIHSPYQVSTMSFYENLAAGVVIFVPDVPLLKVLQSYKEFFLPEDMAPEAIPWHLVEWYTPYFDPVVIKFSSTDHLIELLETTDFEAQRQRVLDFMTAHEKRTLEQWKRVMFDVKEKRSG